MELTACCSYKCSQSEERIVHYSGVWRPDIGKGPFNQYEARASEEASEEATHRQGSERA